MDLDLGIAVAAILFVQEGRKEENVTERNCVSGFTHLNPVIALSLPATSLYAFSFSNIGLRLEYWTYGIGRTNSDQKQKQKGRT